MLAIIGGSGLEQLDGLVVEKKHQVITPYGRPSTYILQGRFNGRPMLFLSRHGGAELGHLAPHLINYRANIWALKSLGAEQIIAVAAVGGITANYPPQSLSVPDQIIDYTWGREHTFVEAGDKVQHINFCQPYKQSLRLTLLSAAAQAGLPIVDGACYGATQGPRLETAAEIARLKRDGCDIVGMTGMPEAALAMEAGLEYASLALVVNWGAGVLDQEIPLPEIYTNLELGMAGVRAVLGCC